MPMTAGALRTLLETLPENTPLSEDATGLPIIDARVDVDGALELILDGPAPHHSVVNTFSGTVDGFFIQAGSVRGTTIRL